MWLVVALSAQAHVPQTEVIQSVERRTLPTRRQTPWAVQPAGDDGLVAYTEERGVLVARRYDTGLALQWSVALPEVVREAPARTLHHDGAAWAVFQHKSLAVVTRHDLEDGSSNAWIVPLESRGRRIVDFEVAASDAWLVLVDGNSAQGGGLRHLDLETGISKSVRLPSHRGTIGVQRLTAQPSRGTVDVAYRTSVDGRFTQHVAVAQRGRLVNDVVLQVPDLNLLDVQRHFLDDGGQLVVGTYADEATGTRAQGFYSARLDGKGHVLFTATHSFSTLRHFFDYLPPERRQLRRRQVAERLRRGEDIDIDVRFSTHDVQWRDGQLVLSGEIYSPRIGTVPRVAYVVDGTIQPPVLDANDGYWFTHGVVAAFQPDGAIAWDASLPLRNVGGMRVQPHLRVGIDGDVATLAYVTGDTLISRVFDAGELVEERSKRGLVPLDRTTTRATPLVARPWFDNQWIVFGPQRLRTGGRHFVLERLRSGVPTEGGEEPPKAVLKPIKSN